MAVPYDIERRWRIDSGKEPKLFCQGCGDQVEDSNGFNTQHELLDCVKQLRRMVERLESRVEDLESNVKYKD